MHVDEKVRRYLLEIVHETRKHRRSEPGRQPASVDCLFRTAQLLAAISGRSFVQPDDVKRMASVLNHRLILRPESRLRKVTAAALVEEIVEDAGANGVGTDEMGVGVKPSCWFAGALFRSCRSGVQPGTPGLRHVRTIRSDRGQSGIDPHLAENLTATRECNRYTAQIGDTVAIAITVKIGGVADSVGPLRICCQCQALLPPPPRLRVEGRRLQLIMLFGHSRKTLLYQLHCQQRGYFQIGPLVLETGDVFGLHRRYRVATLPHYLLVYPEVVPLEGYEISSRRPMGEIRMSYRLYEDPTRIAGVRP